MEKITISTGHPDAGRVYAEAYDAALTREASLREELSKLADDCCEKFDDILDLQQRLTVAEQLLKRSQEFVAFVHKCCRKNKEYAPLHWQEMVELDRDLSALKPAAEGEGS